MKNRPKRRRYKDNPYFLSVDDDNIKYVSFNDPSKIVLEKTDNNVLY